MYWKRQADKSFRCANYDEASKYYNLGVKHSPEQSADLKGACYEALADVALMLQSTGICISLYGSVTEEQSTKLAIVPNYLIILRTVTMIL